MTQLSRSHIVPRTVEALARYQQLIERNPEMPAVEILPLIFKLKGKPYDVRTGHFPMEPVFKLRNVPRRQVLRSARQLSKSTTLAAKDVLTAMAMPHINILTVTPLFEQVRKFSNNYVRPFLNECAFRSQIVGSDRNNNSVLQRTLANGANLFYSYAGDSADRVRGTPADCCSIDECQDMNSDALDVIESCLSASPHKLLRYSGTSKTSDGTLEELWNLSSQGVWHIPCTTQGCLEENRCDVATGHLLKMIDHPKTLVCHKCGQPLDSRLGFYIHGFPERRLLFAGYHVPQVIFPMHYASPVAWSVIQTALKEKPAFHVFNEILGIPYDLGSKLVTREDLEAASVLEVQEPASFNHSVYRASCLGIDWSGRGKERASDKEDFISNTALALAGLRHDGVIEIRWLYKTLYSADHNEEAELVVASGAGAHVDYIAHDFTGAGDVRETLLLNHGWPISRLIPFTLTRRSNNYGIVTFSPSGTTGARSSYSLDKPRSLLLLCELIKRKKVLLPQYAGNAKFLEDFYHLFHETTEGPRGKTSLVKKVPGETDDVVMAINNAVMGLYHALNAWPSLTDAFVTPDYGPSEANGWEADDL
jgi:hypothetical protein